MNYHDHMATGISKRTGATMARIWCYEFGNASCTHSTKLCFVFNFAVWHCHIKISSQFFVVEAYAWPQDFLRKHHSVRKKNRISRCECWVGDSWVDEVASCLNRFLKLPQVGKKHKPLLNGCQKMMIQHVEKMVTVAWFSMWANHGNSDLVSFGT